MVDLLIKLGGLDRRWIFLFMGFAVTIPFAFNLAFKEVPTPEVQAAYDLIANAPEGSKVLVPFDFDPPSEPELRPMAESFLRLLALKKHKLYFMALWPNGKSEIIDVVAKVLTKEFPDYRYGEDYVNLGYMPGNQAVITLMQSSISKTFGGADVNNKSYRELPLMAGVDSIKDFDFIVNVSAGFPGAKEWVQFGADPAKKPMVVGSVAVQTPLLYPYYPQQIRGILGGLKSAAEFESLLMTNYSDRYKDIALFDGIRRMGPQTFAHFVIMFFITVGNLSYFAARRRGGAR